MVYKRGSDNRVADALSRKSSHEAECSSISTCAPQWLTEVVQGYQVDEHALSMISKLAIDSSAVPNFSLQQNILR